MSKIVLDEKHMLEALLEAQKAFDLNEIPVGSIIIDKNNKIIGRGHNTTEVDKRALRHAELIAIAQASKALDSWRLDNTTLFVTLEPCLMCYGAILESRISRVVFGAQNNREISMMTIENLKSSKIIIKERVLQKNCEELLNSFFQKIRKVQSE